MKSKVKKITGDGSWNDLYKFEIELDNGDIGKLYKKRDDSGLSIGQEIDYNINEKGSLKIITNYEKSYAKSNNRGSDKEELICRQSSLKCATDFIIANGGDSNDVIKLAEKFVAFVMHDKYIQRIDSSENLPF